MQRENDSIDSAFGRVNETCTSAVGSTHSDEDGRAVDRDTALEHMDDYLERRT